MSLPLGYGAPVVRVFNAKGTEVFERVTAFSYMHSEKVNDSTRIIIETLDISLVDHKELQPGKVLKVLFGYLNANVRVHKVWIWDVTAQFNAQGLRLEIIAYCKAAYMKLNASQEVYNNASLDQVADAMGKKYGLDVLKEEPGASIHHYNGPTESVLNIGRQDAAGEFSKNAFVTSARDATAVPMVVNPEITSRTKITDTTSRYTFKKHEAIPQGNGSDAKQLDMMASIEPTDNLVIEGRDDQLIIKKRNLLQKPYKAYAYFAEPGYLLEFTPAVRNVVKRKRAVSSTTGGWEEATQKFFQGSIDGSNSPAPVLGDSIEIPTEIPNELDGLASLEYNESSDNGKEVTKEINTEKLDNGKEWNNITKYGVKVRPEILDFSSLNVKTLIPVDEVAREFPIAFPKEYIPATEVTKKDAAGKAINKQSKEEAEINECTASMVGDPELQSGRIITIMNVGVKYSGNYYIISAEHTVTPNEGYITRCILFRNGTKKLTKDESLVNPNYIGRDVNKQQALPNDGTETLNEIPVKPD